jgi:hypothetical protein
MRDLENVNADPMQRFRRKAHLSIQPRPQTGMEAIQTQHRAHHAKAVARGAGPGAAALGVRHTLPAAS